MLENNSLSIAPLHLVSNKSGVFKRDITLFNISPLSIDIQPTDTMRTHNSNADLTIDLGRHVKQSYTQNFHRFNTISLTKRTCNYGSC